MPLNHDEATKIHAHLYPYSGKSAIINADTMREKLNIDEEKLLEAPFYVDTHTIAGKRQHIIDVAGIREFLGMEKPEHKEWTLRALKQKAARHEL